jgi:Protein involved in formate dehydrogenase formation
VSSSAGSSTFPPARSEPREVVELRRLRERQPQLASAIDLQLELIDMHRRMAVRVSIPRNYRDVSALEERLTRGETLLRYEDIALDWGELRRLLRDVSDLLRRFGMMDAEDVQRVQALTRESQALEPLVRWWYESMASPERAGDAPIEGAENFEHALLLAMRPFLARSAEVLLARVDCSAWTRAVCPMCGGHPDFGVWSTDGVRHLVCGRCTGQWRFAEEACPFCESCDPAHRRSFASPSRTYRVDACDKCQRYLKGFDGRAANRPLMLGFDAIATLPLDAAAIQQGFVG